ncbi:hypothetical protein [Sagittula stellata]|uniref:Cation/multidrug efflux pump n=1 Tax=Sagittula stellata (strain ATCC 700073 / DSM 11524 / E-37) TaxID=388399 RepID=A3K8Z0_SAGS3|nr:hypothetical protein [Sagittula stellata]EBA06373.1 hypothetical protein SSE37_18085 [Sagittula stellata E-37]
MLAFGRFFILAFVICSAAYVVLWLSLRARRRRLILEEWKANPDEMSLHAYLDAETTRWDRARHRTLIVLVYILPMCAVTAIIYLTNFH